MHKTIFYNYFGAERPDFRNIFFYNSDSNWISETGTDASVTSRTLKVQDRDAYDALVTKGLPANWKIGSNCTVLDKDGNAITE